jgi:hypothetical protein
LVQQDAGLLEQLPGGGHERGPRVLNRLTKTAGERGNVPAHGADVGIGV